MCRCWGERRKKHLKGKWHLEFTGGEKGGNGRIKVPSATQSKSGSFGVTGQTDPEARIDHGGLWI